MLAYFSQIKYKFLDQTNHLGIFSTLLNFWGLQIYNCFCIDDINSWFHLFEKWILRTSWKKRYRSILMGSCCWSFLNTFRKSLSLHFICFCCRWEHQHDNPPYYIATVKIFIIALERLLSCSSNLRALYCSNWFKMGYRILCLFHMRMHFISWKLVHEGLLFYNWSCHWLWSL